MTGQTQPRTTLQHFNLADDSGWWRVANPIIYIAQLLDPAELGVPYIGDRVDNPARTLSLDRVLAFHGYPMPTNRLQAWVISEELRAADAFPSIDAGGLNRSLLHGERLDQQLDFQQMANALQALAPFDSTALHSTRLHLTSASWLARSLKGAAQYLNGVLQDNGKEGEAAAVAEHYYDRAAQAIHVQPRPTTASAKAYALRPESPGLRWHALTRLADKIGLDIYPDHSLSLAGCLQVYGIKQPAGATECTALVARLRQRPMPAPTLYAAARSLDERYIYSRFIGMLNDRHSLRDALHRAADSGTLKGSTGLDAIIGIDADVLPPKLMPARLQLRQLVDQPEFAAIFAKHKIDRKSHVLFSVETGMGAFATDGSWKSFETEVMAKARLAPLVQALLTVAKQLGGELRTNEAISLRQALRLYNIPLPSTLEEARRTADRLVITVVHPNYESNYWRALIPTKAAHPAGWTLSQADRQRLLSVSRAFLPDPDQSLFGYLSEPLLTDKTQMDVRAEADLLMGRLIASPRAQQLARRLDEAVQWQGSEASVPGGRAGRSALVWAALILSVDSHADEHPTRINGLDWAAPYYWGESVAFVRLQIENSFRGFDPATAALAAHLMLCGQAPHLLVRDIPDSLSFLSTQSWVLFEQYATYLEQRIRGSARQMSHDEILYVAYQPLRGSWSLFLDSPEATPPILTWAATNGIVPRQARYTIEQTNHATAELNSLRSRLQSAEDTFNKPVPTRRQVAFEALKKVYPQSLLLEDLVWEWQPNGQSQNNPHTGKKYALIDLYIANELIASSRRWASSDPGIHFAEMARRFDQLPPFNPVFAQAFAEHLKWMQAACSNYLLSTLPALSLPRREALEFGKVEFFSLRRGTGPVGTFGLIICASFYSDQHVYECFPKYLLMRPRRDLNYTTLRNAAATGQALSTLAFEWPAYATGAEPSKDVPVKVLPGVHINQLDSVLAEVDHLPEPDADGHRIPRSLDSTRSQALANIIIERHYLQQGAQLHAQALLVPSLAQLSRGDDPWADYLLSMALAAK
ncbi:hypothetical protein HX823_27150 [Pseudomonas sp. P7759]|uniref:hypothetical protein n=1 Tax=Pseudomonas sp. P7759 TaxID=2738831 RepID=UPI0015A09F8E|nr:hypothetical protein [Pseudomonas sp. P7759]NWC77763.1 hypothetical protein [Pseudomonas sp. P7759]